MREQLSCSQSKQKNIFPKITQIRFLKMKQNINMKIYLDDYFNEYEIKT